MITRKEARLLAEREARSRLESAVILDDNTVENDFGWVFFWNTEAFGRTGDVSDAVTGNKPIIIERTTGRVGTLPGTLFQPLEQRIAEYRSAAEQNGSSVAD